MARRGEARVFPAAVGACGAVLVGMSFLPFTWLALAAAVAFGTAFSVAIVTAITLIQRLSEQEMRGRLLGAAHMLFRGALAAGALGVGGVATALKPLLPPPGQAMFDANQLGLLLGGALILAGAVASRGVAATPHRAADQAPTVAGLAPVPAEPRSAEHSD